MTTIKIDNFSPENLRVLRPEIEAALKEVADRFGITLTLAKITYDPMTATFRAPIEGKASAAGDLKAKQAVEMARAYGVECTQPSTHPRSLGAVLVEYRTKSRTRPWCYSLGGKLWLTDDRGLRMMWPAVVYEAGKGLMPAEVAPPR